MPCKGVRTPEKQLEKVASEYGELAEALTLWRASLHRAKKRESEGKLRAEILFEALDLITATVTLLRLIFSPAEIIRGAELVAIKNSLRGYTED